MFDIKKETEEIYGKLLEWRRDFHRHPELSGQEVRTAGIVAAHLRNLGLKVTEQVGGTGVVGILEGGQPGRVLAMRADMDALPIDEATELPYASECPGVMHANRARSAAMTATRPWLWERRRFWPATGSR